MDTTRQQSGGFRSPDRWNSVPVPERVAQRAYERVDVDENGCWISRYSVASHGYAQIGWQDTKVHMNSARVERMVVSKSGKPRVGSICGLCRPIYLARNNWRTRHPGEPMPEHLLLATEKEVQR